MIEAALLISVYGYGILAMGLLGFIHKPVIILYTVVYISLVLFYLLRYKKQRIRLGSKKITKKERLIATGILFLFLVNGIGVLGPEVGFDALWYHLTLPKVYLQTHSISHIGGVLYYSDMPRLIEMLYVGALSFGNENLAKFTHFLFSILLAAALFSFSRKHLGREYALLAVLIFLTNLVVAWESTTAYIDLGRTFFEFMAFTCFVEWMVAKKRKWFLLSAVFVGVAISTKLLALGSIGIFCGMIVLYYSKEKISLKKILTTLCLFTGVALLIPLPWFVLSFLATGKPFYPFFTDLHISTQGYSLLNPVQAVYDFWQVLAKGDDPISPLYLIFLPFVALYYKKLPQAVKAAVHYSLFALLVWYITPRIGGGRFLMPYLPVFSFITAYTIYKITCSLNFGKLMRYSVVGVISFVVLLTFIYRGAANVKYIPYIVGEESKEEFLSNHLNFSFGDFYDTDGYFLKTVKEEDTVLLYGFHNLYYVNFRYIDGAIVKNGDTFNYIAVQSGEIPERFADWNLLYANPLTHVRLYSAGGMQWVY